jgi:large subunit ribosomal protein L3
MRSCLATAARAVAAARPIPPPAAAAAAVAASEEKWSTLIKRAAANMAKPPLQWTEMQPKVRVVRACLREGCGCACAEARRRLTAARRRRPPPAARRPPPATRPPPPARAVQAEWTPDSVRTGVIALKIGMIPDWDYWGTRQPLTVLQLRKVQVLQIKKPEKDGYMAMQVGAGSVKMKRLNRAALGHFAKAGVEPKRTLHEFRVTADAVLPVGTELSARHFVPGQYVNVTGVTIGKGFEGVMKRWGFRGQPASHGVSVTHRSLGSTGCRQDPGKVFKGKKMPGHMGRVQQTTRGLWVYKIDVDRNLIYVRGAVPGHKVCAHAHSARPRGRLRGLGGGLERAEPQEQQQQCHVHTPTPSPLTHVLAHASLAPRVQPPPCRARL